MNNVLIDDSLVMRLFDRLSPRHLARAFKQALRKSANILLKETKRSLKRKIGNAALHRNHWNHKTLQSGIRVKVGNESGSFHTDNFFSKVHIMGDYRLKFFEKGTNNRHTASGANRGRMRPTNFFSEAKSAKMREAQDSLTRNLAEAINRINTRR